MEQKGTGIGHMAAFTAYAIFGVNIIVCKDLTSSGLISPLALFSMRSLGAGALFWLLSLCLPKEKVERKDFPKIFWASVFGFFLTQVSFLMGMPHVTPLTCSVLSTMAPIYTMLIAAVALKEPISMQKAGGVALSFVGIIYLILHSVSVTSGVAESTPMGIFLIVVNCLCFSIYLGVFKPIITKYSVVTFMKWIFFFSIVMSVPFTAKEILTLNYAAIPTSHLLELSYLIVCATFITYFLIPVGQKRIRPTLVSMYSYVQPIIAIVLSISIGMDKLTWQKVVAVTLVFTGVVLVNYSRSAKQNQ